MDENFNPNRVVQGSSEVFAKSPGSHQSGAGAARADGNAPLFAVLGALEDGQVDVTGDIVATRAGPETYHPIKALKGMASESDVIILSCLTKAPAAGEATSAVRSALQSVIVRPPPAMIHNPGPGGRATTAAGGVVPNLRAISPSAHSAVVDGSLLRAFTPTRARTVLAGLTPPPLVGGGGTQELPTVVAPVYGGPGGLCFLGQRATSEGFSAFSVRRESELEEGHEGEEEWVAPRIDELLYEFEGRARVSASALYDLWGTSNGYLVGGAEGGVGGAQEAAKAGPFARLATEWDCSSHATRTLGSAPPPACSSLLLIGGECPPSAVSLALRGDIERLSAAVGEAPTLQARRKAKGPFGGGRDSSSGDGASLESERVRWEEDLQVLLSGSENMAAFATKLSNAPAGDDRDGNDGSEGQESYAEDDTAVQERKDGGGLGGEEEDIGSTRHDLSGKFRGDLDFSERLWELAARATDVEGVRFAVESAFDAVGEGQIFPVISRDNKTAAGSHIRDGVSIAREARRYHGGSSSGIGVVPRDEAKAKAWRERGSALLADPETLAKAFVELGVHKVTRDLLHWLEVHAGVLAADVDRALPTVAAAPGARPAASTDLGDCRLDRLLTLADTLDLVTLAQSYGAPWRQVRALAHSGLATLRRPSPSSSPVFALGLPKPIPPRARCKLAHPVFWEVFLEPERGDGGTGTWETVSYTLAKAGLFQLGGADEPPVLSRDAARAAQAALQGCPAHLVPEVLSSVTGDDSFAAFKRRQLERNAKGAGAGSDAVFVCEHRFTPW